jgi:hypothetical protein
MNRPASWSGLILGILPILIGAIFITLLGVRWLSPKLNGGIVLVSGIVALLVFVSLVVLRPPEPWTLGLLAAFAFLAGGFLAAWFSPASIAWPRAAFLVAVVAVIAALVGTSPAPRILPPGRGLRVAGWAYALGWGAMAASQRFNGLATVWAGLGLLLFGGLLAAWVAAWRRGDLAKSPAADAVDLYVLTANLLLSALILIGGAPQ